MKWYFRLLTRAVLPMLPFQYQLRALKRRKTPFNEENATGVLRYTGVIFRQLRSSGFEFPGKTALELGTGWEPQIPLLLRLAGCSNVMTVDLHRLLDIESCKRTVDFFKKKRDEIVNLIEIPPESFARYIEKLSFESVAAFLKTASIDYLSPCDARHLPSADDSVDLVISNNVLEHIPPEIILEIFVEFYRVLNSSGKMAHTIDNCDHWSYTDRSISTVNFLQFEDRLWKRIQFNPIDYQNRLRHFEYLDLLSRAGFTLQGDVSVFEESLVEILKKLPICSRYRSIPHEQLAIALSRIVAGKTGK